MKNKKHLLVVAALALSMMAPMAVHADDTNTDLKSEDSIETMADEEIDETDDTNEMIEPISEETGEETEVDVVYVVADRELEGAEGKLPGFEEIADEDFAAVLNGIVEDFFNAVMKDAGEEATVTFSYETFSDENYLSVAIAASAVTEEGTINYLKAFVLDQNVYKLCSLADILGVNAYDIVNEYVGSLGLEGDVAAGTEFLLKGTTLTIFADKEVTIDLNDCVALILGQDEYYQNDESVMIPLRKFAESFRCVVEWEAETSTAYVVSGDNRYPVNAGVAANDEYSLASAPELKDDRLYVPVEFADILGVSHQTADGAIVFTKLFYTAPEVTEGEETEGEETVEETEETETEESLSIKGEIVSYDGYYLTIRAENGFDIRFDVEDADVTGVTNFVPGYKVEIFYTGEVKGDSAEDAVVVNVVSID